MRPAISSIMHSWRSQSHNQRWAHAYYEVCACKYAVIHTKCPLRLYAEVCRKNIAPPALPNLFHVIRDTFGKKNLEGPVNFSATPAPGAQNSKWRPWLVGGHTIFFPMGDKSKILFSSMGFLGTGNAMKLF